MAHVIWFCSYTRFGNDSYPTVLSSVDCSTPTYLVILQCSFNSTPPSSCTDEDDVSVQCCEFCDYTHFDKGVDRSSALVCILLRFQLMIVLLLYNIHVHFVITPIQCVASWYKFPVHLLKFLTVSSAMCMFTCLRGHCSKNTAFFINIICSWNISQLWHATTVCVGKRDKHFISQAFIFMIVSICCNVNLVIVSVY